jgi:hypothetical protein
LNRHDKFRLGGGLALQGEPQSLSEVACTVGGSATPAARRAAVTAARGAERSRKRLPSCSTSVSVSASKVDGEVALAAGFQEAPIPGVTDQHLVFLSWHSKAARMAARSAASLSAC